MTTSAPRRRALTTSALLTLGIVLVLLFGRSGTVRGPREGGPTADLLVEAFVSPDSLPKQWLSESFTDSLQVALSRIPGLTVQPSRDQGRRAGFMLRGEIHRRGTRLVITTRLLEHGVDAPLWSATFWRDETQAAAFSADLAADVAAALYGYIARSRVTTAGGRP